ncbi:MAG: GspH/FimT family pseudopilin [Pseudomonadota bacterium]
MTRRLAGRGELGYTIIELLVVIVILGVIGVVAGPRFFSSSDFDGRAYYDELSSALRYGQKIAIASGCPVRATISTTSYSLSQQSALSGHCNPSDSSFPLAVLLPSGEAVTGNAPTGVTTAPATAFVFDAEGRTSLGSDTAFTVGGFSLAVEAGTGLVITP